MTAKEYINIMLETSRIEGTKFNFVQASDKQVEACMIAFAQEKVQEALQAAAENATARVESIYTPATDPSNPYMFQEVQIIDKESILNAYSIENIK